MARTSSNSTNASFNFGDVTVFDGVTSAMWSFWIKVNSWTDSSQTPFSKDDFPTQNAGWGFQRNVSANDLAFFARGGAGSTAWNFIDSMNTNLWIHIALWLDASFIHGWLNGASKINASIGRNALGNNSNNMNISIRDSNIAMAELALYRNMSNGKDQMMAQSLARGVNPLSLQIRPDFYAPLYGNSVTSEYSTSGIPAITPSNSIYTNHPPVKLFKTRPRSMAFPLSPVSLIKQRRSIGNRVGSYTYYTGV